MLRHDQSVVLDGVEFMRRFLQHVLPKGFVRIRHYGLLAPAQRKKKLQKCRRLLGALANERPKSRDAILTDLFSGTHTHCQFCQHGVWKPFDILLPAPERQNWVLALGN